MKEEIRNRLLNTGATAVGFARAGEIDPEVNSSYSKWIEKRCHGEMGYLERHLKLRKTTESVLPGALTVISLAFSYVPSEWRRSDLPYVATYAYGKDYHSVLRDILHPVIKEMSDNYGGKWRLCIDSAPVAERYWAMKSGIGLLGKNGVVIIPGSGAFNFLVEIFTTYEISPDIPSVAPCHGCYACLDACPTKALKGDGTMDARLCLNYLTIEKKDEFTDLEKESLNKDNGYLYGCDRCLKVCPHNKENTASKNIFAQDRLINNILHILPDDILSLDKQEFKRLFKDSPLNYAGYERLRRNALAIKK